MRTGIALLFHLLIAHLFANFDNTPQDLVIAAMEGEPSVTIDCSVNPISGDYIISETDLVIPGYESINISRTYVSGNQKGRKAHWSMFPHVYMHVSIPKNRKTEHTIITVCEPSGSAIRYKNLVADHGKNRHHFFPMLGKSTRGLTNTARGEIGARTNISRHHLYYDKGYEGYILVTCDGTDRYYKASSSPDLYCLEKERKPNGNWIFYGYYQYDFRLREIRTTNPRNTKTYTKVIFENDNINSFMSKNFSVSAEKKELLHYLFHRQDIEDAEELDGGYSHHFRLNCINRAYLPQETLHYQEIPHTPHTFLVNNRKLDDRSVAEIEYYHSKDNLVGEQLVKVGKSKDPIVTRVKSIKQPVAPDGGLAYTHLFFYNLGQYARNSEGEVKSYLKQTGYTYCMDAYNKKTEYAFNDFFVPLHTYKFGIELCNPKHGNEGLLFEEHFCWTFDGQLNRLRSKSHRAHEKTISLQLFNYDDKGNVIKESLIGNISGHNHSSILPSRKGYQPGPDDYSTTSTYNDDKYALITRKNFPNGLSYKYEYLAETNLPSAIFTLCHDQVKIREFNVYNEDHVITEIIIDDGSTYDRNNLTGVTQRTIKCIQPKQHHPAMNFPEIIEEKYLDISTNTYHLLKKIVFHYSSDCTVIQEDLYDANNLFVCSTHKNYDQKRRLIQSTDSLGRVSSFSYNNLNQLTEEHLGHSPLKMTYSQDVLGRKFAVASTDTSGSLKESRTVYDLKSRIIQITDPANNVIEISYDDLDHECERIFPAVTTADGQTVRGITKTFNDPYGRPLSAIDPLGHTTTFSYNILGKPTSISYPDNTQEIFYYNMEGSLKEHHSMTGLCSYFTYDPLGRVLRKAIHSKTDDFLYEELFVYDSFNLLSHIDEKGVKTSYRYDSCGRKIEVFKSKNDEFIAREEYVYDALGRHYKTITHNNSSSDEVQVQLKVFDNANRVIEESQQNASGALFAKVQYQYDRYDNKISITTQTDQGVSVETFTYDDYKRVTSYTDSDGNTSYTQHIDRLYNTQTNSYEYEKILTDPKGRQLKERYNSIDKLISITRLSSVGTIQSEDLFYYDLNGNKVKQLSKLFAQDSILREVCTLWEYDSKNRVITLIEAHKDPSQKITRFTYTADGKEKIVTQPDGTSLEYLYDPLSRLISLKSSDHSIHYTFLYDQAGNLIEEINQLTGAKTLRTYNARGNILKETLANGLSIQRTFDGLGRKTSLTLHDNTVVHYDFDAFHLKKVSKLTPTGELHYEHHYLSYNLQHQPTLESSIFDLCHITKTYDNQTRHIAIQSPYYSEQIQQFDSCGNILQMHTDSTLNVTDSSYVYDELDHLIKEDGVIDHSYDFDSHHNRIVKDSTVYTTNHLNELLQEGHFSYEYSLNGNRTLKKVGNKALTYQYDALNRLVSLRSETIEMVFTYDSWHRRLSKSTRRLSFFGYWETFYQEYYLYDDDKEIASTDTSFKIKQLRVLGLGKGGDIGAAISIEIEGVPYIPSYDLFGNIVNLVHAEYNYIAESYRYSAFGESQIYSYYHLLLDDTFINNHWRYQSKRSDDESGLVFFGRRYYDSSVGCWLSPDPLGLSQGPNLYQFLCANPLSNIDIYGLSILDRSNTTQENPYLKPVTWESYNPIPSIPYNETPYRTPSPLVTVPSPTYNPTPLTPTRDLYHSPRLHLGQGYQEHPKYSFTTVNGINTQLHEGQAMAELCAKNLGHNVDLFYNQTNGLMSDLLKVGLHHMRFPSDIVDDFKKYLMHEVDKGKEVFAFAHSGGGGVVHNALESLPKSYQEKINVITFGSAKYIPKEFGKTVINYVSSNDLVCIGSNVWYQSLISEEMRTEDIRNTYSVIQYLKPHTRGVLQEHAFMGKTYQRALENRCNFIKKKFFH